MKSDKSKPAKGGPVFGGNFKKDLLLIDLEMTGLVPNKHEIVQLSAVLLDKKTLKEKTWFNAYIKPKKWKSRDLESMQVNGLTWELLKEAPDLRVVLKSFSQKFKPKEVILANYGGLLDFTFLKEAYAKSGVKWNFDYHYFNLWCVFYWELARSNSLKNAKQFAGFKLDELVKKFNIKIQGARHDALTDCRLEAEVLRKMVEKSS